MKISRFFQTIALLLLVCLQMPFKHSSASNQEKSGWSVEHLLKQRDSLIKSNRYLRTMLDGVLLSIAKQVDVHVLDKDLGSESIESWISGITGNPSNVAWEWNDCGESVGHEPGGDYAVCVLGQFEVTSNKFGINVVVATEKSGVTEPSLWMVYVQPANGPTQLLYSLTKLKEYIKGSLNNP